MKKLVALILIIGIFCTFAVASAATKPLATITCTQANTTLVNQIDAWNVQHLQEVQNWVMSSDGWWNYTPQELFEMTSETGRPGCSF